jgi:hypothetical protein
VARSRKRWCLRCLFHATISSDSMAMDKGRESRKDCGVALIMILWVLILLDIIVLQFATSMKTEVEVTRNFRDSFESYYLARAAVEMAKYELKYVGSKTTTHGMSDGQVDFRADDEVTREGNPLWKRESPFGNGIFKIEYEAIDAKSDLNSLVKNERALEDMLIDCNIEAESSELSMIKRSIIDWSDKDDTLAGPDIGAEDDWYKENWEGYECKDDDFYSVEELALIRGLRPEMRDSDEERKRKEEILKRLYEKVDAHPFMRWTLNTNMSDPNSTLIKGRKSIYYEVIATGWIKEGLAQRQIKAEFNISKGGTAKLITWTDNYIPLEEYTKDEENDHYEGDDH